MKATLLALLAVAAADTPLDPLDVTPPVAACGGWGPNPCAFSDNAVLASSTPFSRGVTPARLFGAAAAGEQLTLSGLPAGAVVTPSNPFTAGADGAWSVTVASPDSPAPSNITLVGSSGKSATLHNVRFGLTLLCSGQSNMDMSLSNCFYANETLAASPDYPDIVYKRGPSSPWYVTGTSNASLAAFSATCFFTALHLKQNVPAMKDVPIGLVQSSVGGTTIESWLSADALAAAGIANAACGVRGCGNQSYCGNYASLIAPLAPTVFKHMAWYQGESNSDCNFENATRGYYARLLPALISSWRALFDTPFSALVVMLAPSGNGLDEQPAERTRDAWPALRDAQLSALTVDGAGLIYPIDVDDDGKTVYTPPSARHGGLHPRNKTEFGRRLALALALAEGWLPPGVLGAGPALAGAAPSAGGVALTFAADGSAAGLELKPTADCDTFNKTGPGPGACCQNDASAAAPHGFPFELEAGGAWVLARATVDGARVQLAPLAPGAGALSGRVRYAWQNWPLCVLANGQGLPLPPFER